MSDIKCPEPGLYEDIDFTEYCAWPYINNSSLPSALRSMAHYRSAQDNPRDYTSDALRFGTFAHAGKLEPLTVAQHCVVMPAFENDVRRDDGTEYANPKASKPYKDKVAEFRRVNETKEVVSQEWFDTLLGMCESLWQNERAREYLASDCPSEVSIVWDDADTGLRCKARIDKWDFPRRRLSDMKTTQDAADFPRSIAKFGYHRQAAFYLDGIRTLTQYPHEFCIVAIEKEAPYGVRSAPMEDSSIEVGRRQYKLALQAIAECRESEEWPGYADPDEWQLPEWALTSGEKVTLSVGGQNVTL